MFVAADTTWDGKVALAYHSDYEPEVQAIVPFLPLILEVKFNSSVWIWFVPELQASNEGFFWDPISGTVKSGEDDQLAEALADFDSYEPFELLEDDEEGAAMNVDADAGIPRFDLDLQIDLTASKDSQPVFQMGAGSVGTFRPDLYHTNNSMSISTDATTTDTSSLTPDSFSHHNRQQNDSTYADGMYQK